MNLDTIKAEVHFPLYSRISELLAYWNVATTRIAPNGWSIIISSLTLFWRIQPQALPTDVELNYLISMVNSDVGEGYYYVKSRPSMKIVEDVPTKCRIGNNNFGLLVVIGEQSMHTMCWATSKSLMIMASVEVSYIIYDYSCRTNLTLSTFCRCSEGQS